MTTTQRPSALERPSFWLLLFALFIVAAFAWAMRRADGDFSAAFASLRRAAGSAVEVVTPEPERPAAGAAAAESRIERMTDRLTDLEIKAAVQQALLAEPLAPAGAVTVEASGGRVILEGQVADTGERYRAELAARGVPGVTAVDNRLTVPAGAPQSEADERLAKAIEFELYSTGAFDLAGLEIVADGGAVRLGGTVRSPAERLLAERLAAEVEGVARVLNALEVRAPKPPEAMPKPPAP